MQSMFNDAGIDKKVVNHSGRVYCCSTLYNAWFEEQDVMKRSGHRSSTVRTYKRASAEKEREMSDVLSPPAPKPSAKKVNKHYPYLHHHRLQSLPRLSLHAALY